MHLQLLILAFNQYATAFIAKLKADKCKCCVYISPKAVSGGTSPPNCQTISGVCKDLRPVKPRPVVLQTPKQYHGIVKKYMCQTMVCVQQSHCTAYKSIPLILTQHFIFIPIKLLHLVFKPTLWSDCLVSMYMLFGISDPSLF